jgi:hypothetical protein
MNFREADSGKPAQALTLRDDHPRLIYNHKWAKANLSAQ